MSLRHLHARKRTTRRDLEPFPSPRFWKRFLDRVIFAVGVAGPMMTLPQILRIYLEQDATGVAPATWGLYALFNPVWILYGLVHREWPIVITYTLWFAFNTTVFVGALLYGA